jgi:hypothetical protein
MSDRERVGGTEETDGALIWYVDIEGGADGRCLARPVRSEQPEDAARRYRQV